jgi:1,4-dihydroxy-2-naphthoate octaprenyltransferase
MPSTTVNNLLRALRLPFISASVLPFIFGSLIEKSHFNILTFMLGLISVVATHLGANLINDYADAKSGNDWQDCKFYGFFGGSKLIQEKVFSEAFYLKSAVFCFSLALSSIIALYIVLKSSIIIIYYFMILILGIAYSLKPLKLSYRRLGEPLIFLLFGPALVMGGYFLQSGIFPNIKSFILSLPFGFLTTAILVANEIPDSLGDKKSGKFNWVNSIGPDKSYILYSIVILCAFFAIAFSILKGMLGIFSSLAFLAILPASGAIGILKNNYADKIKLMQSSRLTIAVHILVSILLIIGNII